MLNYHHFNIIVNFIDNTVKSVSVLNILLLMFPMCAFIVYNCLLENVGVDTAENERNVSESTFTPSDLTVVLRKKTVQVIGIVKALLAGSRFPDKKGLATGLSIGGPSSGFL